MPSPHPSGRNPSPQTPFPHFHTSFSASPFLKSTPLPSPPAYPRVCDANNLKSCAHEHQIKCKNNCFSCRRYNLKVFKQNNALPWTTHHHRLNFLTLILIKGRLGWKPVTRGYKLTALRRTALCHTPAPDCKLKLALRNPWIRSIIACISILLPGTVKGGRTRMDL